MAVVAMTELLAVMNCRRVNRMRHGGVRGALLLYTLGHICCDVLRHLRAHQDACGVQLGRLSDAGKSPGKRLATIDVI